MKTVCKKLLSLMLVALLLVSAIPFQASAADKVRVQISIPGIAGEDGIIRDQYYELGTKLSEIFRTELWCNNRYAKHISDGKTFDHYEYAGGALAGDVAKGTKKLSADMADADGVVYIEAVFDYATKSIKLKPNGGTCSVSSIDVKVGDTYPELPEPKREGYVFAGWYTGISDVQVWWGAPVENYQNLVAKWDLGTYRVTFQYWNGTDWADSSFDYHVPNGMSLQKYVDDNGGYIPKYDSSFGTKVGYTADEDTWVDDTGVLFSPNKKITRDTKVRPNFEANTYTITYDFACEELAPETTTIKFDSIVKNLKKPTRRDYVFVGWQVKEDGYRFIEEGETYKYGDITLVAAWGPKATVEMRVYRDDADGFKTYYYTGAIVNNQLDLNEIDIEDYLSGTYDFDGWFDYDGWIMYKADDPNATPITRIVPVTTTSGKSQTTIVYGMVKGYKAPNSNNGNSGNGTGTNNNYNNNSSTADPSNPTTGDMISTVFTVMAVSAGALALVYFDMKKRQTAK